jgi:hypothetical protein
MPRSASGAAFPLPPSGQKLVLRRPVSAIRVGGASGQLRKEGCPVGSPSAITKRSAVEGGGVGLEMNFAADPPNEPVVFPRKVSILNLALFL